MAIALLFGNVLLSGSIIIVSHLPRTVLELHVILVSLLREAQAKEEEARLEALLLEGLVSQSLPLNDDFLKRLETKTEAIINKHGSRKAQ